MGQPFDLLLGRKTYDIFAAYWPHQSGEDSGADPLNRAVKYVATHRPIENAWKETVRIANNVPDEIRRIKEGDGPMLEVHGSSVLIQTLLANDLVDEMWLKIFPVMLGTARADGSSMPPQFVHLPSPLMRLSTKGKRLFGEGTIPAAFKLVKSSTSPSGVVVANYERAGEVQTGTFE